MLTAPVARLPAASFGKHPVVPLELVMPRLKPPANIPQDTPALFSRSPMFLPVIWTVLGEEQTSLVGSSSPMRVKPPWPSATTPLAAPDEAIAPLVWPETRLTAP